MLSERMEHLESRLPDIDKRSEALFLSLGSGFPRLLEELRRNLDSSAEYVDSHVDPYGHGGRLGGDLNSIWNDTQSVLSSASRHFSTLAIRDDVVFTALREGIGRLAELGEQIHELRRDAIDMELLAINAVITACKAGKAGRGFAYLANELKTLAVGTVEGTERLSGDGQVSLELLTGFQTVVEEMAAFQRRFFGEFERKLSVGFNDLIGHVGTLSESLRNTVDRAREVETPLRRIMEEIQIQDIIMQSISHVILVAERAKGGESAVSDDGVQVPMLQLAVELVCDIRIKLATCLQVFKDNLSALRRILAEVGEIPGRTGETPESAATGQHKTADHMETAFEEPVILLQKITEGITQANAHRVDLRDKGLAITAQVAAVVDQLSTLSRSIARLYPIQVLSRIQVAEEPRLDSNRSAIQGIREFVRKVTTHVAATLKGTSAGLSQIERVVSDYSANSDREVDVARRISNEIGALTTALLTAQTDLTVSMDQFSVFSNRFHELLEHAERDVGGLETLVVEIDQLIEELGGDEVQLNPAALAADADENMGDVVESLVDRFTIARHKSSAASLVGMEVEGGSDEGELTLF